jgi:hypothetical protein
MMTFGIQSVMTPNIQLRKRNEIRGAKLKLVLPHPKKYATVGIRGLKKKLQKR